MQQLSILSSDFINYRVCAITGHRSLPADFNREKLKNTLACLLEKGVNTFYNGLAMGFDLLTAELLLELKENYPETKLYGCIPFYGQEKYYSAADQQRYGKILKECDAVFLLSENYYKGCYHKRNLYMIEHAEALLAYCLTNRGGTAYTVKEFSRLKGKENVFFYV